MIKRILPHAFAALSVAVGLGSQSLPAAVIWDDAVALYDFNGNLLDSNGTSHGVGKQEPISGTVAPVFSNVGAGLLPGWDGSALSLSDQRYVDLGQGASNAFQLTGSFTLFARVQVASDGSFSVISKDGAGGFRSYAMRVNSVTAGGGTLSTRLNGSKVVEATSSDLAVGKWVDLVMVYEASTRIELYINGISLTTSTSGVPSLLVNNTSVPLLIGAQPYPSPNGDPPNIDNPFPGLVERVAIWNYALSDEQALSLSVPEPGTVTLVLTAAMTGVAVYFRRRIAA